MPSKRRNLSILNAPELKALDTAVSLAADTTGAVQLLNGIQPGTALNQRVGRQIQVTHLTYRLACTVTAATGVDQFHRVLIVLDRQPNGVAPAVNEVIDGGSTSQYNLSNQKRFAILYDKRYYLNASGEPGSGAVLNGEKPVNILVQYNSGVAGTVADLATNSIYMIVLGTIAAGATAGSVAGSVRLRYYDQ
jgi:hypothetical protein